MIARVDVAQLNRGTTCLLWKHQIRLRFSSH